MTTFLAIDSNGVWAKNSKLIFDRSRLARGSVLVRVSSVPRYEAAAVTQKSEACTQATRLPC
jgi:hypothetical protein